MAGIRISYLGTTLGNYYARVYKWSSTPGTELTHLWDNTAGAWDTIDNVATADAKIAMTEQFHKDFFVHTANLDEYTGWVTVTVHDDDDANDGVVQITELYIVDGAQVALQELYELSAVVVTDSRTFRLPADGSDALNVISVETGSTATLAMDFGKVLNQASSLSAVSSVAVGTGSALTISNSVIDGTKTRVHFDVVASTSGDRVIVVTVTTTDGQTIVGEGHLEIT